jgi:hypothetical protein
MSAMTTIVNKYIFGRPLTFKIIGFLLLLTLSPSLQLERKKVVSFKVCSYAPSLFTRRCLAGVREGVGGWVK